MLDLLCNVVKFQAPKIPSLLTSLLLINQLVFSSSECSVLSPDMGTIIVTYQTDQEGTKLDRVRFWLINENQERTLYPKKDEFVANNHTHGERTVVITHLPVGTYQIEFIFPNRDQQFEKIPKREIRLSQASVVKVDQTIYKKLRSKEIKGEVASYRDMHRIKNRGHLQNIAENGLVNSLEINDNTDLFLRKMLISPAPKVSIPLPSGPVPVSSAQLTLSTDLTVPWRLMHEGQIIYSGTESISQLSIPPGKNYYLLADEIPGYTLTIYPPNPFDIAPGKSIKVDLIYQHDCGSLGVQGELLTDEKFLTIKLVNDLNNETFLETRIKPMGGKISWQSESIPTGDYWILFETDLRSNRQSVSVEKGIRKNIVYR